MAERDRSYRTRAEYDAATKEWNDAGRPGGRAARPSLDTLRTCGKCGGTYDCEGRFGMMPAFAPMIGWCLCDTPTAASHPSTMESGNG
jgi:hypothetical protein